MIESLLLRNFQSHKKTQLNFHPNINAIIGTSNSGKTAILRGLYWIVYNRPSGLSFISHWNRDKKGNPIKETSACITQDNKIITRVRSDELNGYWIENNIDDAVKLEAIGMDVPEVITKNLNLGEVNIQKQMDAPFLLSESSGEVARFFNKEIRLDLIDKILSTAEIKRRKFNSDIKITEASITSTEKELLQYEILEPAKALCDKLETIEKEIVKIQVAYGVCDNFSAQYKEEKEISEKYNNINFEAIEKLFNELDKIKNEEAEIKSNIFSVETGILEVSKLKEEIRIGTRDIKEMEKELPDVCPLCNKLFKEEKE